tara:strand:+ start:19 stop:1140 length:1122 start_codon:yes stop_codon:yes gene_type:complete
MANIKFSQFTAEADIANFDDIVGYAGAVNTKITPANLASSLITLSGGPYLPLTAGASEKLTGDLNLAALGAGPSIGSYAVVFNGVGDGPTSNPIIAAKLFTLDSTAAPDGQDLIFQNADDAGALQENMRISSFGQVGIGTNNPQFNLDVGGQANFQDVVGFQDTITINNDITDTTGVTGQNGKVLAAQSAGGVEWVTDYNAIQSFVWTNGVPVPYVNFPPAPGTLPTNSGLPFDPTPLIQTTSLSTGTTVADYTWTCANAAGGDAGQVATFTLGANGGGVWRVSTANHWFDQNSFIEVIVEFVINGVGIQVTDERSNDGAGDKIYYGELYQEFSAGDTLAVFVTFQNSSTPATTPFPSANGNRPIEVNFERIA